MQPLNSEQISFEFLSNIKEENKKETLADKFLIPPFSILDTKQGQWQNRKRQWLALGIKSESGRPSDITYGITVDGRDTKNHNTAWTDKGKEINNNKEENFYANVISERGGGVSIFDPVLCELMYRWFCPAQGHILDPFAGGSVRGIVATYLGYKYTGIEIRPEQITANKEQAGLLNLAPTYIEGDSTQLARLVPSGELYDMLFTCPPYFDLEIYSDTPQDMSVYKSYFSFIVWYKSIFRQAMSRLKQNRFAVIVVGEIRDEKGYYRNFVGDTIASLIETGAQYYNEAILATAIGSLPVRTSSQFPSGRKLGKCHQNVLIFYKGDIDKIKAINFVDRSEQC